MAHHPCMTFSSQQDWSTHIYTRFKVELRIRIFFLSRGTDLFFSSRESVPDSGWSNFFWRFGSRILFSVGRIADPFLRVVFRIRFWRVGSRVRFLRVGLRIRYWRVGSRIRFLSVGLPDPLLEVRIPDPFFECRTPGSVFEGSIPDPFLNLGSRIRLWGFDPRSGQSLPGSEQSRADTK